VKQLIDDAVAWRMFGLAFERPRDGWRDQVAAIANEVSDPEVRWMAELAKEQASEELFLDLFGPGGAISPREVAYRGLADPGHLLSEIEAMYGAFAYQPVTEECPDHVSVEAGFVSYLRMKQAFARIVGDGEAEAVARDAEAMFVADHLAPVADGLWKRFAEDDSIYIARAARLMRERVGDVEVAPAAEPNDDDEMGCGGTCPL
jgi:nitrate reductase assembly molybdenum cofactor insertion protein NarJ